ncbi:MAG TPA: LssY C-terminal domain-containing protein [Candidatus Acidoferrales bacterium]|nr:LssY C-terminal domain-containing protein [Candidatus Acidoferrales bacterium]
MSKHSVLWIACFAVYSLSASAQSSPTQQQTFQVSSTTQWTDTTLELQAGDVIKVSATAASFGSQSCDPNGINGAATMGNLPLPNASVGALIAKLHPQDAAPIFIGASNELHIKESSHLFLGMNVAGNPPCQGGFSVKVERIPAGTASNSPSQTRGQQLKSQLSNAAQVFMSGQFGMGKSESNAALSNGSTGTSTAAPVSLKISDAPLDSDFRKDLDGLPRRVNDQFNNLGDMVNFVIVGSQKQLQDALEAASWHVADTDNRKAVLSALMETYDSKDYLAMPMSTLYLFNRKQDFGYEMADPIAMVASRHHFRIWKAPFTSKGQEVWVGAGTHDIGFAKDQRNNNVTHKIDPAVDGERENIGSSLQKTGEVKSLTFYLPPNPVQDAKNATGDGYHSDGRLLVMFLQ